LRGSSRPGNEAAITHTRHAQLECADAGIPLAIATAIAFTLPLWSALVALRTQMLSDFELHQCLGHDTDALTQRVHIRLRVGLAQQLGECHAECLGHRLVLLLGCMITSDENHRWPFRSRATPNPHTSADSPPTEDVDEQQPGTETVPEIGLWEEF
jgi:hypothetical protein